ncbi:MAG: 5-formyltetrahydrofolate cyclo-ligase, partial [Bauldia sp.]
IARLAGEGWTTAMPVIEGPRRPLAFRAWKPGEPTVAGVWDIPRPTEDAALLDPDVLIVPLLAFDAEGYRLGYGGGFYDRTLAKLRAMKPVVAVGVAYSAQEMAQAPRGEHDQPVDWVLTEKGPRRLCG